MNVFSVEIQKKKSSCCARALSNANLNVRFKLCNHDHRFINVIVAELRVNSLSLSSSDPSFGSLKKIYGWLKLCGVTLCTL